MIFGRRDSVSEIERMVYASYLFESFAPRSVILYAHWAWPTSFSKSRPDDYHFGTRNFPLSQQLAFLPFCRTVPLLPERSTTYNIGAFDIPCTTFLSQTDRATLL